MNKLIIQTLIVSLLVSLSSHSLATEKDKLSQTLDGLVNGDSAVTEIAGLQLVLLRDGKKLFEYADGMAHISTKGKVTPLTLSHKVRVASISKFVMALGFMTLVEKGQVNLDDDVSKYLGFTLRNPHFPTKKITAKQLLTHTSSIRDAGVYFMPRGEVFQDFFYPSKHYDNGAHFARGNGQEPGRYFNYSNLNFGILAGIIENVAGVRFDQFMDEAVFKPLGLDISFNGCQYSNEGHQYIATLYRRGMWGETWDPKGPWKAQVDDSDRRCYYGGPVVSSETAHQVPELTNYKLGSNPTLFSPQGGLRASANDLAALLQLLMANKLNKTVLSANTVEQMLTPVWTYDKQRKNGHSGGEAGLDDVSSMGLKNAYGLSTHIVNLKDWKLTDTDSIWYGHMAAAYGLLGQMWFNPKTQEGMVILLTGMGDNPEKPKKTTPMAEIEAQVLRIALEGLNKL